MNKKIEKNLIKKLPSLVVSDREGNLFDIPEYGMVVRQGSEIILPEKESIIPIPYGSDFHILPERYPLGINKKTGKIETVRQYFGDEVFAASAFLAPAFTALNLAAFEKTDNANPLPLFAYAALGFKGEGFVVTAIRVDRDNRQDCRNFDQNKIIKKGKELLKKYKGNRLTTHLVNNCAFTYLCPAARNWVMGRWEAPIPISIGCNAQCHGCISKQEEGSGIPVTQDRLTFVPTVDEIVDYTVPHLARAERAVVSFGQGCEGEPLTQATLIEESIREMRRRTEMGTINLNSNGSLPEAVERICKAGLDSIRISMNSVQPLYYDKYFKPKGYSFEDVIEAMRIARNHKKWISLNYFIFPGFTDRLDEMDALKKLLKKVPVNMIQMRNLNVDPDLYFDEMNLGESGEKSMGMRKWMKEIKKVNPEMQFGYFNPPVNL